MYARQLQHKYEMLPCFPDNEEEGAWRFVKIRGLENWKSRQYEQICLQMSSFKSQFANLSSKKVRQQDDPYPASMGTILTVFQELWFVRPEISGGSGLLPCPKSLYLHYLQRILKLKMSSVCRSKYPSLLFHSFPHIIQYSHSAKRIEEMCWSVRYSMSKIS